MTNNKITSTQLISIGCNNIMGTIIISVFVSSVVKNESWLLGILGLIFHIPAMLVYFALIKKFPGKYITEINEIVFGTIAGRALSLYYLLFLMTLCSLNALDACNFLYYSIMPDTPLGVIILFLMSACAYCVSKGIGAIARVSTVFGVSSLACIIFSILLSFDHANFEFLLPVFNLDFIDYVQGTHICVAIPFGGSFVLLALVPDLEKKANVKKVFISVALFCAFIITVVQFHEVISLGPLLPYITQPSYESIRIISIYNIFSRIEILFALLLISLTCFKTMLLLYACLKYTTNIFKLKGYKHLTIMFSLLLTIYSINAYGSPTNNIYWGKNVVPFIWSFSSFVMPLVTLITATARGSGLQTAQSGETA